jgi:di/tricarboxylate transporter
MSYQSDEVEKMKEKVFDRRLVQAVVARKGPLVGKTVKEVRFRTQYGAAVIAVQREGQRVHEHPGQIKLQAGDVLLLEAGPSFMANKVQQDRSFALVAEVQDSAPPRLRMLIPAVVLMVGAYAAYMAKLSTLFGTAMVAAILMVALGVLSESEARAAIQWEIYLTIASGFGIGTALVNSGVAGAVANFLVKIGDGVGIGDAGILGAVYISTVLISQLVANNAAAALIFPIAMDAAEQTGTDMVLMSFTIMLAASAAFMTPFGYQTNLMVMGYGGYNTKDYIVFGTPMQLVLWIATTIYLVTPAWICWVVTFAIFGTAVVYRVMSELKRSNQKSS